MKRILLTAALVAASLTAGTVNQAGADDLPAYCTTIGELLVEDLPPAFTPPTGCDLTGRVIRHDDGGGVVMPEPGTFVSLNVLGRDAGRSLKVTHFSDGSITVAGSSRAAAVDAPPLNTEVPVCATSPAYTLLNQKWYTPLKWYYDASKEPPVIGAGSLFTAIQQGIVNLTNGVNDCGRTTVPAAGQEFLGFGGGAPDINHDLTCGPRNFSSQVGWGPFDDPTILAAACNWGTPGFTPYKVTESDIRFDNDDAPWYTGGPVCASVQSSLLETNTSNPVKVYPQAFDLQGTATHEWGHSFGLGHVPSSGATAALTMSDTAKWCTTEDRTLGVGDLNGMIAVYGAR